MAGQPDVTASTPVESTQDSKKVFWTQLGVGYKTKKGDGFMIYLNGLPVNGKLLIKKFVPKADRQRQEEAKELL